MFSLCSHHRMSHALTAHFRAPLGATLAMPGFIGGRVDAGDIPADLRIPPPPFTRWIPHQPEPAWRQAMRWSLIGLTASLAAGEIALLLQGL